MKERSDDRARRAAEEREERAVYVISVAAELAGVHPQTLRIYERKGLVSPQRTSGNSRRYSDRDIELLQQIQDLTQDGVNLAGVKLIIRMQAELEAARERTARLERELRDSRRFQRRARRGDGTGAGDIVPLRSIFLPPWQRGGDR